MSVQEATVDEYTTFCVGIRNLTKVDLLQYKRAQMERRLRAFAEQRGFARLLDYLEQLKHTPTEVDAFLDRMTINVSQLWRNPEQWEAIGNSVLPELAKGGRVRAWSAGSSYGAEAYTLAAVCAEAIPGNRATITGTDIDRRMIERARAGRFSEDDARSAPSGPLTRHFSREGKEIVASPQLRAMTSFEQGDLLRIDPRRDSFDLVLCRNTVIYFAEPVRDDLHRRLAGAVRSGGYLIVGNTERVSKPAELGLKQTQPFFYRKD